MSLRDILLEHPALVIGNGINLYGDQNDANSWHGLLNRLAKNHLGKVFQYKKGFSLTEFYDILDLHKDTSKPANLQSEFCYSMSKWKPKAQHKFITEYCAEESIPILTTNFDTTLSNASGCQKYKTITKGFTDYYPWECYFAREELTDPVSGFGIWHINGMWNYSRSIRLGLTHYMGSVHRARNWIYPSQSGEKKMISLFDSGGIKQWRGRNTYLQIIMKRPLVFFGLALEENEVFLRWLLLERAKYFQRCREDPPGAWYFIQKGENCDGKRFFLEGVGIEIVEFECYSELYDNEVWSSSGQTQKP